MVKGHRQTHSYGSAMQNPCLQQHLVLVNPQTHSYASIQQRLPSSNFMRLGPLLLNEGGLI